MFLTWFLEMYGNVEGEPPTPTPSPTNYPSRELKSWLHHWASLFFVVLSFLFKKTYHTPSPRTISALPSMALIIAYLGTRKQASKCFLTLQERTSVDDRGHSPVVLLLRWESDEECSWWFWNPRLHLWLPVENPVSWRMEIPCQTGSTCSPCSQNTKYSF